MTASGIPAQGFHRGGRSGDEAQLHSLVAARGDRAHGYGRRFCSNYQTLDEVLNHGSTQHVAAATSFHRQYPVDEHHDDNEYPYVGNT